MFQFSFILFDFTLLFLLFYIFCCFFCYFWLIFVKFSLIFMGSLLLLLFIFYLFVVVLIFKNWRFGMFPKNSWFSTYLLQRIFHDLINTQYNNCKEAICQQTCSHLSNFSIQPYFTPYSQHISNPFLTPRQMLFQFFLHLYMDKNCSPQGFLEFKEFGNKYKK